MNSTHRTCLLPPAVLALALALGAAPAARAETQWTFGGFGTLSLVHSTERQADYTANPISPGSAGYSRDWAYDVDSRLGAQLGMQFDKAEATHKTNKNYKEALALRKEGKSLCAAHKETEGVKKIESALTKIGVKPMVKG